MVEYFVGCPSTGICFSHDGIGVMGFREEGHRNKMPYSSHQSKSTNEQRDLWLLMLTFIAGGGSAVVFLHGKAAFFVNPVSMLSSEEGSHCAQPRLTELAAGPLPRVQRPPGYWGSSCTKGFLCSLNYSLIQLFTTAVRTEVFVSLLGL